MTLQEQQPIAIHRLGIIYSPPTFVVEFQTTSAQIKHTKIMLTDYLSVNNDAEEVTKNLFTECGSIFHTLSHNQVLRLCEALIRGRNSNEESSCHVEDKSNLKSGCDKEGDKKKIAGRPSQSPASLVRTSGQQNLSCQTTRGKSPEGQKRDGTPRNSTAVTEKYAKGETAKHHTVEARETEDNNKRAGKQKERSSAFINSVRNNENEALHSRDTDFLPKGPITSIIEKRCEESSYFNSDDSFEYPTVDSSSIEEDIASFESHVESSSSGSPKSRGCSPSENQTQMADCEVPETLAYTQPENSTAILSKSSNPSKNVERKHGGPLFFGDLNKVSEEELSRAKQAMNVLFESNRVETGDDDYEFDKRVDFEAEMDSSWD